jgi:hypothetical protein
VTYSTPYEEHILAHPNIAHHASVYSAIRYRNSRGFSAQFRAWDSSDLIRDLARAPADRSTLWPIWKAENLRSMYYLDSMSKVARFMGEGRQQPGTVSPRLT